MDFWDQPHDTFSNEAFVGFDSDQDNNGAGFVLNWWTERVYEYDFNDVQEAHQFLAARTAELFNDIKFQKENSIDPDTGKTIVDKGSTPNTRQYP